MPQPSDEQAIDLPGPLLRQIGGHFQAALAAQEAAQAAVAVAQARAQRFADYLAVAARVYGHDPAHVRYDQETSTVLVQHGRDM